MRNRNANNVTIYDAQIGFLNFAGRPDKFNPKGGKRYFSIFLSDEQANELKERGWNVKWPKDYDAEEDARSPHLKVNIHYSDRSQPRVVLITDRGRRGLPEDLVDLIDQIEIEKVDLEFRPYDHQMNGGGRTAYLVKIYVTLAYDELDRKYSHLPEVGDDPRALAIGGGAPEDFVDGDVLHEYSHRELGA